MLVAILGVLLAVLAYQRLSGGSSAAVGAVPGADAGAGAPAAATVPPARAGARAPAAGQTRGPGGSLVPDVDLARLTEPRTELPASERNLFRFRPKAPPSPPPAAVRPQVPAASDRPDGVAPVPPPPPITLKLIGIVEGAFPARKVAVLADPRGDTYYGQEGDIIDGRYRILKIGVESVELAHLDGRGRQMIRLSGQ